MFQFAIDHEVDIDLGLISQLHPKRLHDKPIMEVASEYTSHAPWLQSINKIRMALNVIWLSDISSANGITLDKHCVS